MRATSGSVESSTHAVWPRLFVASAASNEFSTRGVRLFVSIGTLPTCKRSDP